MTSLTVWTNHRFAPEHAVAFERAIAPHRALWSANATASVLHGGASDPGLRARGEVAFGQPDPADLLAAERLKLVCLTSAGYTRYDRDDLRAHCRASGLIVANASGVYDEPCAQHVFAMMLGVCRQLPAALDTQRGGRAWPQAELRARSVILGPATRVAILGYGSIARRLVELLAPFAPQLRAFRRSPRGDENCPTFRVAEADASLGWADHVVNILPSSDETTGFFDAARLARLRPGAAFYNIGRGDTVDQAALEAALRAGAIGHAYLDVTSPEPLPPAHPLWAAPNCFITPHTAGGSADEPERQIEHFAAQLARFARGEPVTHRVI